MANRGDDTISVTWVSEDSEHALTAEDWPGWSVVWPAVWFMAPQPAGRSEAVRLTRLAKAASEAADWDEEGAVVEDVVVELLALEEEECVLEVLDAE